MKKNLRFLGISLVVGLLLVSAFTVFAGSTVKNLSTNFTLVNFEATTATGVIKYLKDTGVAWPGVSSSNLSFSIPGNSQQQFRQYFDTTMEAGQGSVVVSSDTPLGSVAQILARGQTPSSGAYSGFQSGSNRYFLPNLAHQGDSASGKVNSQIIIQNADSTNLNVTVALIPLPGFTGTYTKTVSALAPGVSFYYDVADEANLPTPWFGSAVVKAAGTGKIAVVSNLFLGSDALQTYNGFPEEKLSNTWVVPFLSSKLSNGLNTVVTVQNVSGVGFNINDLVLDCVKDPTSTGTATVQIKNTVSIDNKAAYNFNSFTSADFPTNWYGSCKVTAPGDVVAYVQLRYIGVAGNSGTAAYEAIPLRADTTDKTLFAPLMAKRLANGFATSVLIQNMDFTNDAGITVDLTYTPSTAECPVAICDKNADGIINSADAVTVTGLAISKGGSIQRNLRLVSGAPNSEPGLPNEWIGTLKVTSPNGPIVGVVQLTNIYNTIGDTYMSHDAFTKP